MKPCAEHGLNLGAGQAVLFALSAVAMVQIEDDRNLCTNVRAVKARV